MTAKPIRLIAGLGNPGREYEKTRHNIGFMVLDAVSDQAGILCDTQKFGAEFGRGRYKGRELILVKPMTFMNRSGEPLQQLARYYRVELDEVLVVYDDMDLEFGTLRIRPEGGHGGHNGVRSIIQMAGGGGFSRIRIGVGRPSADRKAVGHVLGQFDGEQKMRVPELVEKAASAALSAVSEDVRYAMNRYNGPLLIG